MLFLGVTHVNWFIVTKVSTEPIVLVFISR